jgi:uncharacterized membrane protein
MARRDDLSKPRGTPGGPQYDPDAFGRFAESIARYLGTGRYLAIQTVVVVVWILVNVAAVALRFDPYPFILLNLMFSVQAAYTGPILLLASNRQASKDRAVAQRDDDELGVIFKLQHEQMQILGLLREAQDKHNLILEKLADNPPPPQVDSSATI